MHIYDLFKNSGIVSLYGIFLLQLKDIINLGMVRIFLEVLMRTTVRNPRRIDKIM